MSTDPTDLPPAKRLRLTLTVDAHNLDDLYHIIRRIANDLDHEGRENRDVISGDGHYKLTVRDPHVPESEYNDALMAWHKRLIAARAAGTE